MSHEDLLDAANEAINKLFSDTSVPASTTRESLEEVMSNIQTMLETLPKDE